MNTLKRCVALLAIPGLLSACDSAESPTLRQNRLIIEKCHRDDSCIGGYVIIDGEVLMIVPNILTTNQEEGVIGFDNIRLIASSSAIGRMEFVLPHSLQWEELRRER